jgi:N-acetylmuramoyl-L-alanine amidase CwlA
MKKDQEIEAHILAKMKEKHEKDVWEQVQAKRVSEEKARFFENNFKKLYNESIEWSEVKFKERLEEEGKKF